MRTLLALALLTAGCSSASTTGSGVPAPAESRAGAALTAEEAAVRAFVLDHADDPKSVEFDRWGPNADAEAVRQFRKDHSPDKGQGPPYIGNPIPEDRRVVRCRFRSNNRRGHPELHDDLYFLGEGSKVVHVAPDMGEDHWLEPYEARVKK